MHLGLGAYSCTSLRNVEISEGNVPVRLFSLRHLRMAADSLEKLRGGERGERFKSLLSMAVWGVQLGQLGQYRDLRRDGAAQAPLCSGPW